MSPRDTLSEGDALIEKTLSWITSANVAFQAAGGDTNAVIGLFPRDLMVTLIRNNVHLTYRKEPNP